MWFDFYGAIIIYGMCITPLAEYVIKSENFEQKQFDSNEDFTNLVLEILDVPSVTFKFFRTKDYPRALGIVFFSVWLQLTINQEIGNEL